MRIKSEVFAAFCSIVVVATLLKANVDPGGTIFLRLDWLDNQDSCGCLGCASLCGYELEIWATCDIDNKSNSDCLYGYSKTRSFWNASSISFGQSLGNGLLNPLAYNFSLFHGTLGFYIRVTSDWILGRRSVTGEFIHRVSHHLQSNGIIKWESINLIAKGSSASRLNLTYSVFCNAHYYGPSCVVQCIPGKTYLCNKTSVSKICIGGWLGPKCNCTETVQYGCNISTGKKICYPPWYGENCDVKCEAKNDSSSGYSCNKTTGAKTCLDGWYGNECKVFQGVSRSSSPGLGVSRSSPPGPNSTTIAATRKIWKTSSEESIGTSVRPDVLSSVGDTKETEPGSREARKKQDVWWIVLLPFALVALLVAAVVVILKKKRGRKRGKISSMKQNDIPLEAETVTNSDGLTKVQS